MSSQISSKEYWTFRNQSNKKFTHGLHLYPARMHPEIARNIIFDYADDKRKIIIDPFVGSGGVLIEAMFHGNNSVGFDINPFAVLLTKVKTTIINPKRAEEEYLKILEKSKRDYRKGGFYPKLIPNNFDIKFWHKPNVIKKLSIIKHHLYNSDSNKKIVDFLKICLSLTVRISDNQRKSEYKNYRMDKDELKNFKPNVFDIFQEICQRNCQLASDFKNMMGGRDTKAIVTYGNALNFSENFKKLELDDSHGHLIMTSPPYGDHDTTVAYGQFSMHPGLWLDLQEFQLREVDRKCLGGQRKNDLKDMDLQSPRLALDLKEVIRRDPIRAQDVYSFFYDLDRSLEQFSKILKHGKSHLCFVVGNRNVRRVSIHTDEILIELGKKYDFKHLTTYPRSIPNKLMSVRNAPENIVNNSGKTMTEESIVLMKY